MCVCVHPRALVLRWSWEHAGLHDLLRDPCAYIRSLDLGTSLQHVLRACAETLAQCSPVTLALLPPSCPPPGALGLEVAEHLWASVSSLDSLAVTELQ